MEINRRYFLKILGISAFGIGIQPSINLFRKNELHASKVLRDPTAHKVKSWAMVLDLKKLDEETAEKCIQACHSIHNVPDIPNKKHEIKWIWAESFHHSFPNQAHGHTKESLKHKPVLVLCNHCENPPCVRVCPTKATFKREDGIVMMDMHRCIGCRFCMAGCPYGSRSFNWKDPVKFIKEQNPEYPTRERGVVEKCNFCADRLDKGLMPKCVEVAEGAIIFGNINDPESEASKVLNSNYTIRRKPSLGTGPAVYYII
jgi:molybdopterin-containing oxidoreductase family iron-sulfur binding subunit